MYEEGVKKIALSALTGINGTVSDICIFVLTFLMICDTVKDHLHYITIACLFIAATVFAYGQTSSGKTYTMRGITEKAVNDIYEHIMNVSFSKATL